MKKIVLVLVSIFLTVMSLAGAAGCTTAQSSSIPLLPAGLDSAKVPDVNLQGYLYFNQSEPIALPDNIPGIDTPLSINAISVYLGTDTGSYGASVNIAPETDTSKITSMFNGDSSLWSFTRGNDFYVTSNTGDWNISFQNAIKQNTTIALNARFPEEAKTFAYFPAQPPAKPLAAGFINLNGELFNSLSEPDLSSILQAIKSANVSSIDFVAYGSNITQVPSQFNTDLLKDYCVLLAGRSTYAATLFNIAFDTFVQNAGLTKIKVNDLTAYSYPLEGITVLVSHSGSIIYAAVAQSQDLAGQLLLSAMNR